MNLGKVLIGGLLGGIVIFVVWMVVSVVVQAVAPYDVLKLGGMRAKDDPVMLLFFMHPWVISFAMAILYDNVGKAVEGGCIGKGLKFGLLSWLMTSIPSVFIVFTSMNYPLAFTAASLLGSFFYMLAAGVTTARIMDK